MFYDIKIIKGHDHDDDVWAYPERNIIYTSYRRNTQNRGKWPFPQDVFRIAGMTD